MPEKRRKYPRCPHCGQAVTDEFLQEAYMFRRRQAGGQAGRVRVEMSLPSGWYSMKKASATLGIPMTKLREMARSGNPAFQKFGRSWGVREDLAR